MTLLGFLNYYFFQFLFIRITRHSVRVIDKMDLVEVSNTPYGMGIGGKVKEFHFIQWFSIQYPVVPLTGWRKWDYKYIGGKAKYFRITKDKTGPRQAMDNLSRMAKETPFNPNIEAVS